MYHDNWWEMPMMWLIWIPFLIICIVLLLKFVDNGSFGKIERSKQESPMDILKRRYANGEINTEEYEERKKQLL